MTPVAINPQPLEALQARYPAALKTVFNLLEIFAGHEPGPGEFLANVFDFEDGLRIIVSRYAVTNKDVRFLQISASLVRPDAPLYAEIRARKLTWKEGLALLAETAEARFRELSGDKRQFTFDGFTPIGSPNWHLEE